MKKHSAFQRSVWRACARIPKGEVRTYGWIAKQIGKPGAARAVGRALAANPFAPAVPCHRVVGADGSLTGYSAPGGIKTKLKLLKKEGWKGNVCDIMSPFQPKGGVGCSSKAARSVKSSASSRSSGH